MNIYKIIQRITSVRSPRLRLAMLYGAHISGRRLIGVYIDPVLGCNLRCKMCGFSDENHRRQMHGRMTDERIVHVARGLFPRSLKVQIGCGAEPTLDKRVPDIIRMAKQSGVPYISVTTNGQLLTSEMLHAYAEAGLDELTLSLHGVQAATYEWLMENASFEKFLNTIDTIRTVKRDFPTLKLRVNFTVNADNVSQLSGVIDLFGHGLIDILQIRPVPKLGETVYNNFNLTAVKAAYDSVLIPLAEQCRQEGITCLMPSREDIDAVPQPRTINQQLFEEMTYCYIGPEECYTGDYDAATDNYRSFHRRNHSTRRLLSRIFSLRSDRPAMNNTTKKLNYGVKTPLVHKH